jgi:hypothetical protein
MIDLTQERPVLTNRPNLFVGEQDRMSIFDGGSGMDLRSLSNR